MKNGKIGVGIIGTGFGRSAQVPGFRSCDGVEVIAVGSSRQERAEAVAGESGIPYAFSDYHAMMELEELDLVSIVTPPYLHYPMTMAAIEAGKHVLCEKPMAMNLAEAQMMYERAQAAGVIHFIDHELRFDPTSMKLQQLIAEGYVGRIYHASIHIATSHRVDPRATTWSWWSQAEKGGGSLGATGSHRIDLLRWWLGEIRSASGELHTFVERRKVADSDEFRAVTSDDQCAFMLEFESGALASAFISSVAHHPSGTRTEIHGESGSLILDADNRLWGRRAGESGATEWTEPNPYSLLPGVASSVWSISFVGLARYVTDCIRTGTQPERGATFYDGLRCQAVMEAIRQSWDERRWVEVRAL